MIKIREEPRGSSLSDFVNGLKAERRLTPLQRYAILLEGGNEFTFMIDSLHPTRNIIIRQFVIAIVYSSPMTIIVRTFTLYQP